MKKVTEYIKTYEDAVKATNRPSNPDFSNLPEDLREHFEAHYQIIVIAEALNEGWKPNWDDDNEPKYIPWFWKENEGVSSGFVFYSTYSRYSNAYAAGGVRLCFKTRALAEYAGKQFIDIWNKVLLK
jgi:hypothetical protein|nr:MAG TPA: hypothetical protein [Caudoviricetes sp.]